MNVPVQRKRMRTLPTAPFLTVIALAALCGESAAKDRVVTLNECPAPVQAVIRHYSAQASFEQVALDEKKKSGGPAVYEAKFALRDGKRIEVHISPEGQVLQFENKKPKE
jgi:hypothetical protein